MKKPDFDPRARTREIQADYAERGDAIGWFEALYKESAGDTEMIPWADLVPNRYFQAWANRTGLRGRGQSALVVGCGLGDDAKFLHDLGFRVTAFDISPTAIEWARKLYGEDDIQFEVADLFQPPRDWIFNTNPRAPAGGTDTAGGFDFVLEIYTIQPLPLKMRPKVVDSIADFVGGGGTLLVVTRGRGDDEEPEIMPWPMSRRDLSRFETNGLKQLSFAEMPPDDDEEPSRFVVEYLRV